ncbi:MAG: hypothetical protein ACOYBY_09045 [Dermatophilaceae bacterium]
MTRVDEPYDGFVVFSYVQGAGSVSTTRGMMLTEGRPPWFSKHGSRH